MVPYHEERQHVTEVFTQAAPVKIMTRMPKKHCDPERQHIFMEIHNFLETMFNLEILLVLSRDEWPDVVAGSCTHFPQLLIWERKKTLKLELKLGMESKRIPHKYGHCKSFLVDETVVERGQLGKGVKKNPTQIWPYLCGIFLNSFPKLPPLRDCFIY